MKEECIQEILYFAGGGAGAGEAPPAPGIGALPLVPGSGELQLAGSTVVAPLQHLLCVELQMYFDKVASIVNSEGDALQLFSPAAFPATQTGSLRQQQEEAATAAAAAAAAERARYAAAQHRALLASLTSDPGLHPLTPYLSKLVVDSVNSNLKSISRLTLLLRIVRAMLGNPHFVLDRYIQQLLAPIFSCMLSKSLGE
ncbi:MAG: hypothetical protein WDW38_002383 [Sanguina aurantia]